MRLLRQISLDGSLLRTSDASAAAAAAAASSSKVEQCKSPEVTGSDHCHHPVMNETIDNTVTLINRLMEAEDEEECNKSLLKLLEKLNSLIVQFIQSSSEKCEPKFEKPKSKIRRQYSAFVESNQLFRLRRHSAACPGTPVKGHDQDQACCSVQELTQKIIDSNLLWLLLTAIPYIDFEGKKLIRIIFTNSLILEANKTRPIVANLCAETNPILEYLVHSYEIGRGDVTLNCGKCFH